MRILRSTLSLILLSAAGMSLASCADMPSRRYGPDAAEPTNPAANDDRGASKPALTIQAGEGEKLNLPWFVRDVRDWVNEGSGPATGDRPPGGS